MDLKLGTNLLLEPTFSSKAEKYRCKIVDQDNHFIFINYPVDTTTNKSVILTDGTQLKVTFVDESKAVYAFPTEVLGRKLGQVPMMKLSIPNTTEILKIQRRNYVRIEHALDIAIEFEGEKFQFITEDLSAGGIAVILNKEVNFHDGDRVSILLPLAFNNGDMKYVFSDAKVIRIWDKQDITIASLEFIDADDTDKQHIVRFCFERQLLLRKKGIS